MSGRRGAGTPVRAASSRHLPLGAAQLAQRAVEVAWVGHHLACGQHGEVGDAQVDTDDPVTGAGHVLAVGQFHAERDVPASALVGQSGRPDAGGPGLDVAGELAGRLVGCLLYTSDAADE